MVHLVKSNENDEAARMGHGGRTPYSSPSVLRISSEAAKELILRNSDVNDPEVRFVLECIERSKDPIVS